MEMAKKFIINVKPCQEAQDYRVLQLHMYVSCLNKLEISAIVSESLAAVSSLSACPPTSERPGPRLLS